MSATSSPSPSATCGAHITDLCNFSCPWCLAEHGRRRDGRAPVRLWSEETREAFFRHIQTVSYTGFAFLGGEPLLFPQELLAALTRIRREVAPDAELSVYTNGSLLTPELADALNALDARVVMSVNLVGPKGLDNLFAHAARGPELVNAVRSMRRRRLRMVFTRKAPFAVEVVALHSIFDCPVELCPDYTTLGAWDDGDIAHLDAQLARLDTLTPERDWLFLLLSGTHRCPCAETPDTFMADGVFRPSVFASSRCIYGCAALQGALGDNLYNQYVVTAGNHARRARRKTTCLL